MSDDPQFDPGAGPAPASTTTRAAPARWRRWFSQALPGGFESQRYLGKWLLLSTAIGVVAGLGALAFAFAIDFVTRISLGALVDYLPPTPFGEGNTGILP